MQVLPQPRTAQTHQTWKICEMLGSLGAGEQHCDDFLSLGGCQLNRVLGTGNHDQRVQRGFSRSLVVYFYSYTQASQDGMIPWPPFHRLSCDARCCGHCPALASFSEHLRADYGPASWLQEPYLTRSTGVYSVRTDSCKSSSSLRHIRSTEGGFQRSLQCGDTGESKILDPSAVLFALNVAVVLRLLNELGQGFWTALL